MTTAFAYLLLTAVLVAPFALIGTIAARAHRDGHLRWNLDQFRFSAPMIGRLFEDDRSLDSDMRRLSHDLDAVRTRFEQQPSWPQSGAFGERR